MTLREEKEALGVQTKVYVVTAYRWGNRGNHSYVVGVRTKKKDAKALAEFEAGYRGNKYECEVVEFDLNGAYEDHVNIVALPIEFQHDHCIHCGGYIGDEDARGKER